MIIEIPTTTRLVLPEAQNSHLQNLYVFNMYRSASSMTVGMASSLARLSGRVGYPLMNVLAQLGVSIVDPGTTDKPSMFVTDGAAMRKLSDFGGYMFFGFREVPVGFSEVFDHVQAAVVAVRDPRDIGISQYYAVQKHVVFDNPMGDHITDLREQTSQQSLEEFILSDGTINFLTRICMCYAPMIHRGVRVIRYEDATEDGEHFSHVPYARAFWEALQPQLATDVPFEKFLRVFEKRLSESDHLKGHAVSGKLRTYRQLPPDVLRAYSERLSAPLQLLGYTND